MGFEDAALNQSPPLELTVMLVHLFLLSLNCLRTFKAVWYLSDQWKHIILISETVQMQCEIQFRYELLDDISEFRFFFTFTEVTVWKVSSGVVTVTNVQDLTYRQYYIKCIGDQNISLLACSRGCHSSKYFLSLHCYKMAIFTDLTRSKMQSITFEKSKQLARNTFQC